MLDNTPENIRRRKAMLLGLQSLLSREQAVIALLLWERDHGRAPASFEGLHLFARNICDQFGKVGRRVELHKNLLAALRTPEAGLPLDPTGDMRLTLRKAARHNGESFALEALVAPTSPAPAEPLGAPSELQATFSLLLRTLDELMRAQHPSVWVDSGAYLAESLPAARLSAPAEAELAAWLRGDKLLAVRIEMNEGQAAGIVHTLYVWCAEMLGPVAADRLFSGAVGVVDATAEGRALSPRALL